MDQFPWKRSHWKNGLKKKNESEGFFLKNPNLRNSGARAASMSNVDGFFCCFFFKISACATAAFRGCSATTSDRCCFTCRPAGASNRRSPATARPKSRRWPETSSRTARPVRCFPNRNPKRNRWRRNRRCCCFVLFLFFLVFHFRFCFVFPSSFRLVWRWFCRHRSENRSIRLKSLAMIAFIFTCFIIS